MNRKRMIFITVAAVISCICLATILFLWKTGVKNYLDCYQILYDAYYSDSIDIDITVSVDSSLIDVNLNFNALRFPYGDSTVTKFTTYDKKGRVEVYQIGGKTFLSTDENYTVSVLPKDFTMLLKWCTELYNSDYTITRKLNGESVRYKVEAPDEKVAALMRSYGGRLGEMDIQYSDCVLIVTIEDGALRDIQLYGIASYTLPIGQKIDAYIKVNADINALGDDVETQVIQDIEGLDYFSDNGKYII